MQIFLMVIIGVIGFILLLGGIFWYFKKQGGGGAQHEFLLFSTDGATAKNIKGRIKVDEVNRSKKEFVFENYSTKLPIKPAQLTINGKGYRLLRVEDKGELHYLKGITIGNDDYLATALNPEEKQIALAAILENNQEFQNPMSKTQAALMVSMMILVLVVVIATVYGVGSLVANSKDMASIAKVQKEVMSSVHGSVLVLSEITAQNAAIVAALTGDANITRRVD